MRISHDTKLSSFGMIAALLVACASLVSGSEATADTVAATTGQGTARIYGAIPPDQIEHLSTSDRIKSAATSGSMTTIWETLEHGERVECLDCIPYVEPLLYDSNPRTREIAAWWLRRRIFGVFTKVPDPARPGEYLPGLYARTVTTLESHADPVQRMYAANALGEFLLSSGVQPIAIAIEKDPDARVRAAAATALGRLNDDGKGALVRALGDGDAKVRLSAIKAAGRINAFSDTAAVARLTGDGDVMVRRQAAELIGTLRAQDGLDGLLGLARDPDASVRNSAAHSLGALHDPRARGVLEDLSRNDPDRLVRDQAQIALRRL